MYNNNHILYIRINITHFICKRINNFLFTYHKDFACFLLEYLCTLILHRNVQSFMIYLHTTLVNVIISYKLASTTMMKSSFVLYPFQLVYANLRLHRNFLNKQSFTITQIFYQGYNLSIYGPCNFSSW